MYRTEGTQTGPFFFDKYIVRNLYMKNFIQLFEDQDFSNLTRELAANPDLWKEDTYLRDYPQGPFNQIESIMIRFPVKGVYETQQEAEQHKLSHDPHENVWYPALEQLPSAYPLIMQLMSSVSGERLGRVMINKIEPGGKIYRHADTPEHAYYYNRFHVVLKGQDGCRFMCGKEEICMETGSIYWFNNVLEHEVLNESTEDRIHMIVDIKTPVYDLAKSESIEGEQE